MKTKHFFLKFSLLTVLIILLNMPVNTIKAQPVKYPSLKKEKDADSLNYVGKYKIKSITISHYGSNDSTLNNVKLESKEKTIYNHDGEYVESISENSIGKMMNKTE